MSTSPLANSAIVQAVSELQRNPTIEDFNFPDGLPTAEELPFSDDTPVDSELQELIPGLLKLILLDIWRKKTGWLFSIDMALYYEASSPAIAPDGFLCLGIQDDPNDELRLSYLLWQEKVIPLFVLETVSKSLGKERTEKMDIYQEIGILYYLVYAPRLKRKAKFQMYKLVAGEYVLQSDGHQPYWMPEVGLGIGAEVGNYRNRQREWLYWYDQDGQRYPTPIERADAEAAARVSAEQRAASEAAARLSAESKSDRLREQLRQLGIEPDV